MTWCAIGFSGGADGGVVLWLSAFAAFIGMIVGLAYGIAVGLVHEALAAVRWRRASAETAVHIVAGMLPGVAFVRIGSSWWFWGGLPSLVGIVMAVHTSCRLRGRVRRIGVDIDQSPAA